MDTNHSERRNLYEYPPQVLACLDWSYLDHGGDRLFMWLNYPNSDRTTSPNRSRESDAWIGGILDGYGNQ
jgi:hypothetical protein